MVYSHLKNIVKLEGCIQNLDVIKNVGEVNEVMISEHMARKETFETNIVFSCSEMEDIIMKIQNMKTSNLFESDIEQIKSIMKDKRNIFEKNWEEKYDIMKQDFDFHVYNMEQASRLKEIDGYLFNLTLHHGQDIATEKDLESMLENKLEKIKLVKMRI